MLNHGIFDSKVEGWQAGPSPGPADQTRRATRRALAQNSRKIEFPSRAARARAYVTNAAAPACLPPSSGGRRGLGKPASGALVSRPAAPWSAGRQRIGQLPGSALVGWPAAPWSSDLRCLGPSQPACAALVCRAGQRRLTSSWPGSGALVSLLSLKQLQLLITLYTTCLIRCIPIICCSSPNLTN